MTGQPASRPPADWDAATYDRVADPQTAWGRTVLERLHLEGNERVLDAGCGSGRVTALLAERLPRGHVVALDASIAMLAEARRRLAPFGERVSFVQADLGRPLPADLGPVDAVLSTATFHWVADHDALFRHLAAVMRPGARLAAQCGGAGNVAAFERAVAEVGFPSRGTHHFATPADTSRRLQAAGFRDIQTWLTPEPTRFEPGEPFESFLETVCLRELLAGLPAGDRARLVRAVAERLPDATLDYVRLNIVATRG
jgi:trans-aconitate 2-methyltransferase